MNSSTIRVKKIRKAPLFKRSGVNSRSIFMISCGSRLLRVRLTTFTRRAEKGVDLTFPLSHFGFLNWHLTSDIWYPINFCSPLLETNYSPLSCRVLVRMTNMRQAKEFASLPAYIAPRLRCKQEDFGKQWRASWGFDTRVRSGTAEWGKYESGAEWWDRKEWNMVWKRGLVRIGRENESEL